MYKLEFHNKVVPEDLHKEVFDYCNKHVWTSQWHSNEEGNRIDPSKKEWKKDLIKTYDHRYLYRLPFAANSIELKENDVINRLFDNINDNCFGGKYTLDGSKKEGIIGTGRQWASYMNAQPYDTVKRTKSIHRDWDGSSIESNEEDYCTLIFISNLEWKPSRFSEIIFYGEKHTGEKHGDFLLDSEKYVKREEDIGWPQAVVPNIPGMVILFDGRWWHSTQPTSFLSPELSQHIVFRVRKR